MMSIILIGFMGSGKSTTGRELANRLACSFSEMDQLIELKAQKKIPEIFKNQGEAIFRQMEYQVLIENLITETVIATGGGIITFEKSLAELKHQRCVIYLKGNLETLIKRIQEDQENKRPLADDSSREEIAELFFSREQKYREAATIIVDIEDKSVGKIVSEIMLKIKEVE
ncbi:MULTISPECIES: shikimate kinase [Vagococcus]|uniref:Shikimate kinase n=1 Tax=Vagococcus fluvialis bH819 TaxID=1255619 RepID=A0A1X6WNS2_9ENTE|nr:MULTISPECIES: shikimate kinase [Vagococcus]SLM85908.1 Shikimate kinase I \